MGGHVFEGLKVADFSWVAVGPLITRYLADHGATVVKVESSVRVDICRTTPPFKDEIPGVNHTGWPLEWTRNKYSMTLNFKHPKGIEIARRLVSWADVVTESFAPGVAGRMGLSYEDVRKINPSIVMLSTSMQGQTGPHAPHPGYGIQLTALSGFVHLTGWPDRGPVELYGAYTDFITPRFGIVALVAALNYRRRTGKGQYIDLSQYECSMHFLAPLILDYIVNDRIWNRVGNRSCCAAPHGAYHCRGNDRWCVIAVFTDEEWASFCEVIGNPALTEDQRFSTLLMRLSNVEELDRLVESWTIKHSPEEVMSLMQEAGIAAGVVETGEDLHRDPQLKHRQHFQILDHPDMGRCTHSSLAFKLSKTPSKLRMSAPLLGQHNEYVCANILQMSDEEFVELLQQGVFE